MLKLQLKNIALKRANFAFLMFYIAFPCMAVDQPIRISIHNELMTAIEVELKQESAETVFTKIHINASTTETFFIDKEKYGTIEVSFIQQDFKYAGSIFANHKAIGFSSSMEETIKTVKSNIVKTENYRELQLTVCEINEDEWGEWTDTSSNGSNDDETALTPTAKTPQEEQARTESSLTLEALEVGNATPFIETKTALTLAAAGATAYLVFNLLK